MQGLHAFLILISMGLLGVASQAADENFSAGYSAFNKGDFPQAQAKFQDSLKTASVVDEYKMFYLARSLQEQNKLKEAAVMLQKMVDRKPNHRLHMEALFSLGELEHSFGNLKKARAYLSRVEKRYRGTDLYPRVVWELAEVERSSQRKGAMCGYLLTLFTKFPKFKKVADWGPDLDENIFEGKKTGCQFDFEDFKTRLRYMVWGGLDIKAKAEMELVRDRIKKTDETLADVLQAQFYIMENDPDKAYEIVKPRLRNKTNDLEFLSNFAIIAARALDFNAAVASYLRIYQITPQSAKGRSAIGQAAYLSYIGQDYDGAYRRYLEIQRKFPNTQMAKDSEWYIAWIRYLRGDYVGSTQAYLDILTDLNRSKKRTGVKERTAYWLAMSYFRNGQLSEAKQIFSLLSKDPTLGYYSIASKARLNKLPMIPDKLPELNHPSPPRMVSRYMQNVFPLVEEEVDTAISEVEYLQLHFADFDRSTDSEEAIGPISDSGAIETIDSLAEIPDPAGMKPDFQRRLEQAKVLVQLGLEDWAKWDLYEIEKKSSNRELLKSLMALYQQMRSYNRSSYIAQIHFTSPRLQQPMEASRLYWELAYPEAYKDDVSKSSKEFKVPPDLVWGIMRAESQFKPEAISPVGAMGLMQVMPITGIKLSEVLKEPKFLPTDLLQPPTSIRYGSRYLKRLLDRFNNLYPLVAAGYNAGPHRVRNWMGLFGRLETDEFIDHIPFTETRNYVKKVISNSYVYKMLYEKQGEKISYLADPLPSMSDDRSPSAQSWDEI